MPRSVSSTFVPPRAPARRRLVGLRIPEWATFARSVTNGILDHMRLHERWELRDENNGYGELEPTQIDADWRGDGIITFRATEAELAAWRARGLAVVNISSEGSCGAYPRVIPDNAAAGELAARHLIACGLHHFVFIGRGAVSYPGREQWVSGERRYVAERLAGFTRALAQSGMQPDVRLLPALTYDARTTWKSVTESVRAILATLPRPCGVFAVDDMLGVSVLRTAASLGLRVPEDLAVIGFGDDATFCHLTHPAMSSVCYPGRALGALAAARLAEQWAGRATPAVSVVPVSAVNARESTDCLAVADPEVARLIALIRTRAAREPLLVSEVFAATKLSPTSVKDRFNTVLGHGPKVEIIATRLRRLRYLMSETASSDESIARATGFASVGEMRRFLARHDAGGRAV